MMTRLMQLVHELTKRNIHSTKRDLFYADVKLFEKQTNSDAILEELSLMFGCTRHSLQVSNDPALHWTCRSSPETQRVPAGDGVREGAGGGADPVQRRRRRDRLHQDGSPPPPPPPPPSSSY